ncbi:hypothetical protein IEQ34_011828 [Dendrobium chrysotoxum]|uniref:DUF4283 domain-containing protein n=1 Tax=Dendrobium chrysotoxum TaxID=161865 RepID=A0AAV7GB59_DENCH|nr:hypothetical protein IEQ34_011828 [Dendrobium chrysotoxum]
MGRARASVPGVASSVDHWCRGEFSSIAFPLFCFPFSSTAKSRSFLEALSVSSSPSVSFPDLKQTSYHGFPALWVSEDEFFALAEPFTVFFHRSYLVYNCFMKLTKWSRSEDIDVDSPIIPIWISFSNLRPHFFSPRILHGLGASIR